MGFGDNGIFLLKQVEGTRLKAYRDGAGVWTIGTGHTGRDVHEGMTITAAEAMDLLLLDVKLAVAAVNHCVKVRPTQNQFDAMVCFAFNVGSGAFARSTLLADFNAGRTEDAQAQFLRWHYAGDYEVEGLVKRRELEAALFSA